jgi:hypothetical protein
VRTMIWALSMSRKKGERRQIREERGNDREPGGCERQPRARAKRK